MGHSQIQGPNEMGDSQIEGPRRWATVRLRAPIHKMGHSHIEGPNEMAQSQIEGWANTIKLLMFNYPKKLRQEGSTQGGLQSWMIDHGFEYLSCAEPSDTIFSSGRVALCNIVKGQAISSKHVCRLYTASMRTLLAASLCLILCCAISCQAAPDLQARTATRIQVNIRVQ